MVWSYNFGIYLDLNLILKNNWIVEGNFVQKKVQPKVVNRKLTFELSLYNGVDYVTYWMPW